MGSPGQGLIADSHPLLFRQRGQRPQVRDLQFADPPAVRLHIAAQQQRLAAQLAHQSKLAPSAGHIRRKLRPTGAFKIAKGLKSAIVNPEIGGKLADFRRRPRIRDRLFSKISTP